MKGRKLKFMTGMVVMEVALRHVARFNETIKYIIALIRFNIMVGFGENKLPGKLKLLSFFHEFSIVIKLF